MTTTTPTTRQPVQRFRIGSITLAIWQNTDRTGRAFYTTSITRRYRGNDGQWQSSGSLRAADLPVVRSLTEQATHWLSHHEGTVVDRHGLMTPAPQLAPEDDTDFTSHESVAAAIQPVNSR